MMGLLYKLQRTLSYDGCVSFQFKGDGIGKIGTTGFLLGFVGGELCVKNSLLEQVFKGTQRKLIFYALKSAPRIARGLHADVYNHSNVWSGTYS